MGLPCCVNEPLIRLSRLKCVCLCPYVSACNAGTWRLAAYARHLFVNVCDDRRKKNIHRPRNQEKEGGQGTTLKMLTIMKEESGVGWRKLHVETLTRIGLSKKKIDALLEASKRVKSEIAWCVLGLRGWWSVVGRAAIWLFFLALILFRG